VSLLLLWHGRIFARLLVVLRLPIRLQVRLMVMLSLIDRLWMLMPVLLLMLLVLLLRVGGTERRRRRTVRQSAVTESRESLQWRSELLHCTTHCFTPHAPMCMACVHSAGHELQRSTHDCE
jgi:hypothetical protein